MGPILTIAANVVYYSLDYAGKVGKDFDAAASGGKVVNLGLKYINKDFKSTECLFQPLAATLKAIGDSSSIRSWAGKVITIVSGQAAGALDTDRIWISPTVSIPNVLKISCISCQLAADILGSLKWLDNLELIDFANLSSNIGNLPVLGRLTIGITLQSAMGTLNVIGIIIDLADTTRDICQNGLTFYNGTQVVADVAKLVGIVLATTSGNLLIIAIIADGTATLCSLGRFAMKSYNIGMCYEKPLKT